jgi:hypothetical protein
MWKIKVAGDIVMTRKFDPLQEIPVWNQKV